MNRKIMSDFFIVVLLLFGFIINILKSKLNYFFLFPLIIIFGYHYFLINIKACELNDLISIKLIKKHIIEKQTELDKIEIKFFIDKITKELFENTAQESILKLNQ